MSPFPRGFLRLVILQANQTTCGSMLLSVVFFGFDRAFFSAAFNGFRIGPGNVNVIVSRCVSLLLFGDFFFGRLRRYRFAIGRFRCFPVSFRFRHFSFLRVTSRLGFCRVFHLRTVGFGHVFFGLPDFTRLGGRFRHNALIGYAGDCDSLTFLHLSCYMTILKIACARFGRFSQVSGKLLAILRAFRF